MDYQDLFTRFVHKYNRLPTEVDPDYLEMLRMSKYRILAVPDFSPGKCSNCGASKNDGRRYVDFGLQLEWYGTVYLCGLCIEDIARNMGLLQKYEDNVVKADLALAAVQGLQSQGVELHEALLSVFAGFEEYYAGLRATGNDSSSDPTPSVVPDETAVKSGTNETKSRTSKSNTSSGSKDVRSLTELLNDPR